MLPFSLLLPERCNKKKKRARRRRRKKALLMAWLLAEEERKWKYQLTLEGRHRRERRLPRESLLSPDLSAWTQLYDSGNDQAMITITGFDHAAFASLLSLFEGWFNRHTPWTGCQDGTTFQELDPERYRGGRSRIIDAKTCLGLVLAWFRFRGAEYILQGWFGFTGSHANVWLRFGRRGLLIVLQNDPSARVEMPSTQQVQLLKSIVQARHDLLDDVYAFADGLKLFFESTTDRDEQSMYYNGWKHAHFVTNLFVFSADGRCIAAVLNAPGSLHDSTLAEWGGIYAELEDMYNRSGGKCCVDSAFSTVNNRYLVKSSENYGNAVNALDMLRMEQATSLRQAAEWGMGAIQSSFPRLKDRIRYENNGERGVVLSLVPLLYNYRLAKVGLNQIRNVYCPSWSVDSAFFIRNVADDET
jgi:DDE superfamily endonuclease